jgi:hypothetical protein
MIRFDVHDNRRLQAVVLAMKAADRDLRSDINKAIRQTMGPPWKSLVELHATSTLDARVLAKGAKITAGNPPVLVAASSTRPLKGGLVPAQLWSVAEFGGYGIKRTTYQTHSRRGRAYQVTRHTQHQLPQLAKTGRVLYPAIADFMPRAAALLTQLVVKKYLDAAETEG